MRGSMLNYLLRSESLVTKPRIWGKLPAHGDYLQLGVSVDEARAWQEWVGATWIHRDIAPPLASKSKQTQELAKWVSINVPTQEIMPKQMPIAFLTPPGSLPFNPKHYLQGVMMDSRDRVGRECPLIVYQLVAPAWTRRFWQSPDPDAGRNVLFWLSRLLAVAERQQDFGNLANAVQSICEQYQPGWRQILGGTINQPNIGLIEKIVADFSAHTADETHSPRGVRSMPWADWPERTLRAHKPRPAYWVQDAYGRYLTASDALSRLWRGVR